MQALLLAALVMQVKVDANVPRDTADASKKDVNIQITLGASEDSDRRREPRRIPVTEEHLRTAYKSPLARTLLLRARAARMAQDSALLSYDASAYVRISAGMGF